MSISIKPKIKIVHLLLDPLDPQDIPLEAWNSTMDKQRRSVELFSRIAHRFHAYTQIYNRVNRTEVPSEGCADPELIDLSKDLIKSPPVLSYGHYGAYRAHSQAILNEFSEDIDALIIVESDVLFELNDYEAVQKIYASYDFMNSMNGHILTFGAVKYGLASRASQMDTSVSHGDWKRIDHFLCAHCYMIMRGERERIHHKLLNSGWHAWDIWFYWNYDCKADIYCTSTPLAYEPEGYSMIDYQLKDQEWQGESI